MIYLPPPEPPFAVPRKEPEVEKLMRLQAKPEPLVLGKVGKGAKTAKVPVPASRPARRKARSTEPKAPPRSDMAKASEPEKTAVSEPEKAVVEPPVAEQPLILSEEAPEPIASETDDKVSVGIELARMAFAEMAEEDTPPWETARPLPRGRALAMQPTGLVARVQAWFSRLIPQKEAKPLALAEQEAMTEQMLALRTELALVQARLDKMISTISKL